MLSSEISSTDAHQHNLQVCLYSNLMCIWAPFASGFTTTNIGNTNPERLNPARPVRPWPTSSGGSPQKYPKVKWGRSTKPTLALTYGFALRFKKKQDPPAYSIIFPLQSSKHVGSFWGIPHDINPQKSKSHISYIIISYYIISYNYIILYIL